MSTPSPTSTTMILRCGHCHVDRAEQVPLRIPVLEFCAHLDQANHCPACGATKSMKLLTGTAYTTALARLAPPAAPPAPDQKDAVA